MHVRTHARYLLDWHKERGWFRSELRQLANLAHLARLEHIDNWRVAMNSSFLLRTYVAQLMNFPSNANRTSAAMYARIRTYVRAYAAAHLVDHL